MTVGGILSGKLIQYLATAMLPPQGTFMYHSTPVGITALYCAPEISL